MSEFYDEMQAVAVELIEEFGGPAQVRRAGAPTGPVYNPQPGPPTLHDCKVVELEYSLTNRDATLVLTGDKLGLMSTDVDVVPALEDVLLLGGTPYRFIDLQPLSPGGQVLLYQFHIRR